MLTRPPRKHNVKGINACKQDTKMRIQKCVTTHLKNEKEGESKTERGRCAWHMHQCVNKDI